MFVRATVVVGVVVVVVVVVVESEYFEEIIIVNTPKARLVISMAPVRNLYIYIYYIVKVTFIYII